MSISINSLINEISQIKSIHNLLAEIEETIIKQIAFDSRAVLKDYNCAFFCIKGENTDGHDYIKSAIEAGSKVIIADLKNQAKLNSLNELNNSVVFIYVQNVRKALAEASNLFYGKPSHHLSLIGITGTNGKTTTTHLTAQILSALSEHKIGLVGTLGSKIYKNGKCLKFLGEGSGRTTPEAPELQAQFAEMLKEKCSHIVMEVSSHALEQDRVFASKFEVAVFTNLTQDHLDYHLTMDNYFAAKSKLFSMLGTDGKAIINIDSEWGIKLKETLDNSNTKIFTYSILEQKADLKAQNTEFSVQGIKAEIIANNLEKIKVRLPLDGSFNLYNCLASLGILLSQKQIKFNLDELIKVLSQVEATAGRFQRVLKPDSKDYLPNCIVDYAHTPDGLENVLKTAREILPETGKLICVFGCGGDRDSTKRPIMGRIAAQYADNIIITSDNPRSEDPNQIISDILTGLSSLEKVIIEADRAEAIKKAIQLANSADIVLIAGKGHENYQIFKNKTIHFDDAEEVLKVYKT